MKAQHPIQCRFVFWEALEILRSLRALACGLGKAVLPVYQLNSPAVIQTLQTVEIFFDRRFLATFPGCGELIENSLPFYRRQRSRP